MAYKKLSEQINEINKYYSTDVIKKFENITNYLKGKNDDGSRINKLSDRIQKAKEVLSNYDSKYFDDESLSYLHEIYRVFDEHNKSLEKRRKSDSYKQSVKSRIEKLDDSIENIIKSYYAPSEINEKQRSIDFISDSENEISSSYSSKTDDNSRSANLTEKVKEESPIKTSNIRYYAYAPSDRDDRLEDIIETNQTNTVIPQQQDESFAYQSSNNKEPEFQEITEPKQKEGYISNYISKIRNYFKNKKQELKRNIARIVAGAVLFASGLGIGTYITNKGYEDKIRQLELERNQAKSSYTILFNSSRDLQSKIDELSAKYEGCQTSLQECKNQNIALAKKADDCYKSIKSYSDKKAKKKTAPIKKEVSKSKLSEVKKTEPIITPQNIADSCTKEGEIVLPRYDVSKKDAVDQIGAVIKYHRDRTPKNPLYNIKNIGKALWMGVDVNYTDFEKNQDWTVKDASIGVVEGLVDPIKRPKKVVKDLTGIIGDAVPTIAQETLSIPSNIVKTANKYTLGKVPVVKDTVAPVINFGAASIKTITTAAVEYIIGETAQQAALPHWSRVQLNKPKSYFDLFPVLSYLVNGPHQVVEGKAHCGTDPSAENRQMPDSKGIRVANVVMTGAANYAVIKAADMHNEGHHHEKATKAKGSGGKTTVVPVPVPVPVGGAPPGPHPW